MELLILLLVFLILVVPLWALARTFTLKRDSATRAELEDFRRRLGGLEAKHDKLLKTVESALTATVPAPEGKPAPAPLTPAKPAATPAVPEAKAPPPAIAPGMTVPSAPPPPAAPPPEKPAPPPVATPIPPQKPIAPPITQIPPPPPTATAPPLQTKPAAALPQSTTAPPPAFATKAPQPFSAPARPWADLEERVGTSWLNKIGITVLVIGLGLLLNYWIPTLGKGGKVAVAYTLSAVLLGLGVWGERSERYRNIARVVLGGGWAATYGTTYALHNVNAVRLVESPLAGFLLLLTVAAGIVGHSLRYNSQVVTGFAYVLGFVTVVLGRMNLGTMVASGLLAASLVVVLWQRRWYWLEPVGIAATYGVHWLWLHQEFSELLSKKQFAQFLPSAALLTIYWAVFTVSHYLREERQRDARIWLTTAFLLNAAGYLAVLRYQSIYPELRFWFLLGVGAVYLGLAAFSRRRNRRLSFLLTSTLGAALLLVAIPYRFSGARLEYIWLLEAEAFLFIGWRLADSHLRNLGWGASAALAGYVFYDLGPRFTRGAPPDAALGWLLLGLAVAFYANARYVPRFLKREAGSVDETAAMLCAPVATALLLGAAWVAVPFLWVAMAWAAVALALREYGRWMDDDNLRGCGHGAAAMVLLRLVLVNLHYVPPAGARNLHIFTLGLAAALLYVCAWRMREPQTAGEESEPMQQFIGRGPSAIYAWAAALPVALLVFDLAYKARGDLTWTLLGLTVVAAMVSHPIAVGYLMTAAWLGLPFMWVALVWAVLAVAVGELGAYRKDAVLRLCGHAAALLAVARLLIVNLQYAPPFAGTNLRVLTVALGVALYYVFGRRISSPPSEPEPETPIAGQLVWRGGMAAVYTWAGTLLAWLLLWNEVTRAGVGLAWGMLGLALVEAGRALPDSPLRAQGYTLLALSFGRIFIADLNMDAEVGPFTARVVTVTLLAAMYYYAAFTSEADSRMRTALDWFGSAALVALLRVELAPEWVAAAWAAFVALLFFLGQKIQRPPLVWQAYALTVLVALRCAFDDFYQEGTRTVTVVAASVFLYAVLAATLAAKRRREAEAASAAAGGARRWSTTLDWNAHHLFFFVPTVLLTVLLILEVPRSYLTAAWGAEGVVVFLVALPLGERAFRLFSLGLLLLCVGRIVLVDVWAFDPLGRIISFMGLGAALLVVSYLYTRNRETWRKYL